MTRRRTIGPHHYSHCPTCEAPAAFFKPEEGSFAGGEVSSRDEDLISLKCRVHGRFELPALILQKEGSTGTD
jgi:hypothetical protein